MRKLCDDCPKREIKSTVGYFYWSVCPDPDCKRKEFIDETDGN